MYYDGSDKELCKYCLLVMKWNGFCAGSAFSNFLSIIFLMYCLYA